ncbi:MAG: exo-alpha-sialidase [Planctomycetia bacterium]|nr:exo-alpha-sialidase [Planctomycetia bacterium]
MHMIPYKEKSTTRRRYEQVSDLLHVGQVADLPESSNSGMSNQQRPFSPWASTVVLTILTLGAFAPAASAAEFSAGEHTRKTIYHSPQTPGFTSWVGAWVMPDGSLMVSFTQATGPIEGRQPAPKDVQHKLTWPPPGQPGYDMTGLDLRNVHLRSTDSGKTWTQVSADSFKSCMNGVTNEAQTALADGTVLRGVFGFYLPYDPDLPQTGFVQRSGDGTNTWSKPAVPLDAAKYMTWPRRIRVLRDGRVVLLAGVARAAAGSQTRQEFSSFVEPALLISSDNGRNWTGPVAATIAEQRGGWTEEFDVAELVSGDLLAIFRRASDTNRWQSTLKKTDDRWVAQKAGPSVLPHSGQPELLATREGPILHVATSGIHSTSDGGASWHKLDLPGTAYYPRALQAADGRIFVFGHVGGDDAYGKVDQAIIMDIFRLKSE